MTKRERHDALVNARVDVDQVNLFDARAKLHGRNRSEMLRYLIAAFVEGRLTVRQPAAEKLAKKELHSYES